MDFFFLSSQGDIEQQQRFNKCGSVDVVYDIQSHERPKNVIARQYVG